MNSGLECESYIRLDGGSLLCEKGDHSLHEAEETRRTLKMGHCGRKVRMGCMTPECCVFE